MRTAKCRIANRFCCQVRSTENKILRARSKSKTALHRQPRHLRHLRVSFLLDDSALTSSHYRIIASRYAVVHFILLALREFYTSTKLIPQNFHSLCSATFRRSVRCTHCSLRKIRLVVPAIIEKVCKGLFFAYLMCFYRLSCTLLIKDFFW